MKGISFIYGFCVSKKLGIDMIQDIKAKAVF